MRTAPRCRHTLRNAASLPARSRVTSTGTPPASVARNEPGSETSSARPPYCHDRAKMSVRSRRSVSSPEYQPYGSVEAVGGAVTRRSYSGGWALGADHDTLSHELQRLGRGHRPAEVEALAVLAPELAQDRRLHLVLDALGDSRQPERRRELEDRVGEPRVGSLGSEPVDERLRDLDQVDRELGEPAQRRVARAEVVEGEADPDLAEPVHRAQRAVLVAERGRLRDLEREPSRVDARARQLDRQLLDQVVVDELAG